MVGAWIKKGIVIDMNGSLTLDDFYKKVSSKIYKKVKLKYKKKDLDDRFSQVLHNSSFRFFYRKYQKKSDKLLTYQESEMEFDRNLDVFVDEVLKGLANVYQMDSSEYLKTIKRATFKECSEKTTKYFSSQDFNSIFRDECFDFLKSKFEKVSEGEGVICFDDLDTFIELDVSSCVEKVMLVINKQL